METRHIALGDLDVAYLTTGPEDGALALLLHGYPDTPFSWRHLAPVLADRGALRYYRSWAQPWRKLPRYRREERAVFGLPPQPLLYLFGADDGCVRPEASRLAAGLCETVEVPGAGHFLALERPDAVASAVEAFLDR